MNEIEQEITNKKIKVGKKEFVLNAPIRCKICNTLIVGKLVKSNDRFFILHNNSNYSGAIYDDLKGFRYSWVFRIKNSSTSDGVELIESINNTDLCYDIKCNNGLYSLELLKVENYKVCNVNSKELFRIQKHPNCCGVGIAYDFCRSEGSTSKYLDLNENEYEFIKENISLLYGKTPLIAHLKLSQKHAVNFLEKIGFKKISEYVNPNSNNTIVVYQNLKEIINENLNPFKRG